MIYLDNAATTKYKPQDVKDAYFYYLSDVGVSPGRGSYSLGIQASRMLYKSRLVIANYFGLDEPNTVFTKNSTEAINLFFNGYLRPGDHVVISAYEHNAVLRPLEQLREKGIIEYSIIKREDLLKSDEEIIEKYFKENTALLALTLASNLTGRIIFKSSLFLAAKKLGVCTFVDASQGAGKIRLNMIGDGIDHLAFTAHKDLKGVPGVGGLCSQKPFDFAPLIQGGTGILGHLKTNPRVYPEGYESGTLNMPGIWALKTAIEYTIEHFDDAISKEKKIIEHLEHRLQTLHCVEVYDLEHLRLGTLAFNVKGYSSNEMVKLLDDNGICTRGGIHCAILAHEALGTTQTGAVRVSVCDSNTLEEIDELIQIISKVN